MRDYMEANPDYPTDEEELIEAALLDMGLVTYVDSWQNMVDTVSKVGYGMRSVDHSEQSFLSILMFVSIFFFALFDQYTKPLKFNKAINKYIMEAAADFQEFVQNLGKTRKGSTVKLDYNLMDIT